MLCQLSRDSWHVDWLPSEDIFVFSEKVGERQFLFLGEVGTDGGRLGGITSTKINLDGVCLGVWGDNFCLLCWDFNIL